MSKHSFGKETKVINKKDLTVEGLRRIIRNLTDSDYNGSNGEDYFKEISKEEYDILNEKGYTVSEYQEEFKVSHLDFMWNKCTEKFNSDEEILYSDKDIIQDILEDNYDGEDSYYEFSAVEVVEIENTIVVFLAYAEFI